MVTNRMTIEAAGKVTASAVIGFPQVSAVGDRVTVIVDCGFWRGGDVNMALALSAARAI